MRVHLDPVGLHSRAMVRVAGALKRFAPSSVTFAEEQKDADLCVLHAIGADSVKGTTDSQPYAVIQYCLETAGMNDPEWRKVWRRSQLVWSYYNLKNKGGNKDFPFYYAPLGIDTTFYCGRLGYQRDITLLTSGFVSGPCEESIEEAAWAVYGAGGKTVHLGPSNIKGMGVPPPGWSFAYDIADLDLMNLYSRTKWVSGLRHIEGFELPALEGLVCGARPVVFDREEMRQWYNGHAVFIPECHGVELVDRLTALFQTEPNPVTESERRQVLARFNWATIATDFWKRLLQ